MKSAVPLTQRPGVALLIVAVTLATLLTWAQWRRWRHVHAQRQHAAATLATMHADGQHILALRTAPQTIAGRSRTHDELLAVVEDALRHSGLDLDRWQDSTPQPAVRLPDSPYQQHTTRLFFEDTRLADLVRFIHTLRTADPTLHVTALTATHTTGTADAYAVDVAVSYLLWIPQDPGRGG